MPGAVSLRPARDARARLDDLIQHLRGSISAMDDAQAKAPFETTAETLGGLKEAFEDVETKDEEAWDG